MNRGLLSEWRLVIGMSPIPDTIGIQTLAFLVFKTDAWISESIPRFRNRRLDLGIDPSISKSTLRSRNRSLDFEIDPSISKSTLRFRNQCLDLGINAFIFRCLRWRRSGCSSPVVRPFKAPDQPLTVDCECNLRNVSASVRRITHG